MESGSIPPHPKQSKTLIASRLPSISSQHSTPSLPMELITEILLKLPVESLCKLKCISKSWLSLISSPHFVKTHLSLSATDKDYTHHRVMFSIAFGHGIKDCSVRSLLYDSVTEAFELYWPPRDPYLCPWVVGYANGLICLAIRITPRYLDFFLWNPSIRKHKKLPSFELNLCDRLNESFGFAYDELQDDYKVMGVFPIDIKLCLCRVEVKIYSLNSDSWRRISYYKGRKGRRFLSPGSGNFLNGKLYWFDLQDDIVSFDLADEKWTEIEKPCNFEGCSSELGVFGNDLCVFCTYLWSSGDGDIWVMKEYEIKESWTKMFTIKSPNYTMEERFLPPILMTNEGEILLRFGPCFIKYNPKNGSSRCSDVTNLDSCIGAEIYVKSLVCPVLHNESNKNKG